MKNLSATIILATTLFVSGCCTNIDKDLLLEYRADLVEDVLPAYREALDKAAGPDGRPLYIDPYKREKLGVVEAMIKGIDRVYPPEAK